MDVAGKPVAVSPTAGNALTWDATGLYAPAGGGGGLDIATGDARYVNTAGDTMTGALTVQGPFVETGPYILGTSIYARWDAGNGGGTIYLDGPDSVNRGFNLQTAAVNRWGVSIEGGYETGSNAGGNLQVYRFSDAGVHLGTALSLSRATGAAVFGGAVTTGGVLTVPNSYVDINSGLNWLLLTQAPGLESRIGFRTDIGLHRWNVVKTLTAESGSNAGSDLELWRHDDAGNKIGTALSLSRATGAATFGGNLNVNGNANFVGGVEVAGPLYVYNILNATGAATFGGAVSAPSLANPSGNLFLSASSTFIVPPSDLTQVLGHPSLRWSGLYGYAGQFDASLAVAGKPVAVSPTAGNALTWDATGLYAPAGGGGGLDIATGDARYVNTAGDTMAGNLTIATAGYPSLVLSGGAGTNRQFVGQTAGVERWTMQFAGRGRRNREQRREQLLPVPPRRRRGHPRERRPHPLPRHGAATFGGAVTANGLVRVNGAAAGDLALETYVGAQTSPRFQIIAGGNMGWGTGNAAPDVTVFRSTGGTLAVTAHWIPSGTRELGRSTARWNGIYGNTIDAATAFTFGTTPAAAGAVRLPNAQNVAWRNAGNTADLTLGVDGSNVLVSSAAVSAPSLTLSGAFTRGSTAQPTITVAASAPSSPATGDLWVW